MRIFHDHQRVSGIDTNPEYVAAHIFNERLDLTRLQVGIETPRFSA
jgi:hypothetical protein